MSLRNLFLFSLSTAALLVTLPAGAQKNSIDAYIRSEMQYEQIPGLALGLYDHGRVVRQQGFGLSNVELKPPVGSETLFRSGSLGKQFVATAVMMLVEQGKVSIDDSVIHYFPDAPKSWEPVKVKNLLSHTSGLGDYSTVELTGRGAAFDFRTDLTEKELLKKLYTLSIVFAPDTDWAYCNTNYVLLGMLIEKVSGEPWNEFLQERIFEPLGMQHARLDKLRDIEAGRAAGYVLQNGELKNEEWTAQTWNSTADGSLELSLDDMIKWDDALRHAKLLKRETLERMWTVFPLKDGRPNSGGYGFGFFVHSIHGHRLIDHEGVWQGFHDYSALYIDDDIGVVVLTNLGAPMSRPQDIGKVVAGLYRPALRPPNILPIPDTHPALTNHLRDALQAAISGKIEPNDYTPEMQTRFKDLGPYQEWLRKQALSLIFNW